MILLYKVVQLPPLTVLQFQILITGTDNLTAVLVNWGCCSTPYSI